MPRQHHPPHQVPLSKALILLAFRPRVFVREAVRHDGSLRKPRSRPQRAESARKMRSAFGWSAISVSVSALLGSAVGRLLLHALGAPSVGQVALLQLLSGAILLWATLSVLGWEIQSYAGRTLAERVNRWVFRCGYCLGTGILAASLAWPVPSLCPLL